MNVLLYADEGFELDLRSLVNALNRRTSFVSFGVGTAKYNSGGEAIARPESYDALPQDLLDEAEDSLRTFLFTNTPYGNNYFFQSSGNIVIVSFYGWEYLTRLPLSNGAVYMIVDNLAQTLDSNYRHHPATGCIYDFLADKTGVDISMRLAHMCPDCLSRLSTKKLSEEHQRIFKDIKTLLDDLSQASKWNDDILKILENERSESANVPKKTGYEITPLDFIPESNDEGYIDVSREQIRDLCNYYVDLRQENYEPHEKGELFETFAVAFFGLIKGWIVLEKNANMEDCEIDIIYDITRGPTLLREKLGDNLYVECKNRSKKSDARDISHFAMNLLSRKLKSGIFFSMKGITGYQPENWRNTTAAYKRIIETSRQLDVTILPIVGEDIEYIRNGGNLVEHLMDLVNRFVRI